MNKSLFTSKTFWLAVAQAAAGTYFMTASDSGSVHVAGAVAIGKSVLDVILRMVTNQGVTVGSEK